MVTMRVMYIYREVMQMSCLCSVQLYNQTVRSRQKDKMKMMIKQNKLFAREQSVEQDIPLLTFDLMDY